MSLPKTPTFTLSFPTLFTPRAVNEGDEPRYSLVALFDRDAQKSTEYSAMKKAALEAARAKFGPDADDLIRRGKIRMPFRDAAEMDKYAGFEEGKTFVRMWTKRAPGVVTRTLEDATADEAYAGARARASYTCWAYDTNGNKGVSFGLENVQIVDATTPRIDGKVKASADFDALDDTADDFEDEDIPF